VACLCGDEAGFCGDGAGLCGLCGGGAGLCMGGADLCGAGGFTNKSLDTTEESVSVVAVLSSEALRMLDDLKGDLFSSTPILWQTAPQFITKLSCTLH